MKAEVLFKFYDLDNNNYLTKDEINFLIRTFTVASKKPAILSEIDRKVDEFILNADIDLDKKLSFKEFQVYHLINIVIPTKKQRNSSNS